YDATGIARLAQVAGILADIGADIEDERDAEMVEQALDLAPMRFRMFGQIPAEAAQQRSDRPRHRVTRRSRAARLDDAAHPPVGADLRFLELSGPFRIARASAPAQPLTQQADARRHGRQQEQADEQKQDALEGRQEKPEHAEHDEDPARPVEHDLLP